jgi:chemotaxis protein histidine kinase CheA
MQKSREPDVPNFAGNLSPRETAILLRRIEPELRALDRGSVRLQEQITGDDLSSVLRAVESVNGASAAAGHKAIAEISQNIVTLLHSRRRSGTLLPADTVDAVLFYVDALRLLKEELSRPAGRVDCETFMRELELVAAYSWPGMQPGTEMAA